MFYAISEKFVYSTGVGNNGEQANAKQKPHGKCQKTAYPCGFCFGANEGTRTPDLLITNQLRYRLRHISVILLSNKIYYTLSFRKMQAPEVKNLI